MTNTNSKRVARVSKSVLDLGRCARELALPRVTAYLTGCHNEGVAAIAHERNVGLLVQPGNSYHLHAHRYPAWAGDNGAFTKNPKGFQPAKFRTMLARPELRAARKTCLFVVAPDKLIVLADGTVVGDARGTLEQFPAWAAEIRAAGFPVAFVAQNGLENMLDDVPWHLVDVLFLGGSTEWKIGAGARACVERAKLEGKRTHMGRVNSYKRLAIAQTWGVDTADGTFLGFAPEQNLPRMLSWFDKLALDADRAAREERLDAAEAERLADARDTAELEPDGNHNLGLN